jgi:hypothetical protein
VLLVAPAVRAVVVVDKTIKAHKLAVQPHRLVKEMLVALVMALPVQQMELVAEAVVLVKLEQIVKLVCHIQRAMVEMGQLHQFQGLVLLMLVVAGAALLLTNNLLPRLVLEVLVAAVLELQHQLLPLHQALLI